jgi:hypothetical protein
MSNAGVGSSQLAALACPSSSTIRVSCARLGDADKTKQMPIIEGTAFMAMPSFETVRLFAATMLRS